jgi:hypothetical protein
MRYLGSDSFNPFSGYYRDEEPIAILRYRGPLREQSAGVVIDALEASPLWKRTHAHLRRRDFLNTSLISQ